MERRIHWVLDGVFNEDQSRCELSYSGIPTGFWSVRPPVCGLAEMKSLAVCAGLDADTMPAAGNGKATAGSLSRLEPIQVFLVSFSARSNRAWLVRFGICLVNPAVNNGARGRACDAEPKSAHKLFTNTQVPHNAVNANNIMQYMSYEIGCPRCLGPLSYRSHLCGSTLSSMHPWARNSSKTGALSVGRFQFRPAPTSSRVADCGHTAKQPGRANS
jgi:hypothetical protein